MKWEAMDLKQQWGGISKAFEGRKEREKSCTYIIISKTKAINTKQQTPAGRDLPVRPVLEGEGRRIPGASLWHRKHLTSSSGCPMWAHGHTHPLPPSHKDRPLHCRPEVAYDNPRVSSTIGLVFWCVVSWFHLGFLLPTFSESDLV